MAGAALDLACNACGRTYGAGPQEPWRCDCGHALDLASPPRLDGVAPDGPAIDRDRGLWALQGLPAVDRRVTLGEGWTPLVEAPGWDASFKLDYLFPSGSFKDRGAATTLSRAVALGVDHVVEDSSGNAGAAIAQYAARAGIAAEIYVPSTVPAAKLEAIERAGAEAIRVEGDRSAVADACRSRVEESDAWYASHAWNPAFYDGTATMALELCAQRGWEPPDVVLTPLGHGTLLLGAYRGFAAMREAGWIDRLPRLLGAQAAGHAPVARRLAESPAEAVPDAPNELADGIQIDHPARPDQLLTALERTGGDAIAIDEASVRKALGALHRAGFYVEPTSAVAPAAITKFRDRGAIAPDDEVVVPLTGSGLKR